MNVVYSRNLLYSSALYLLLPWALLHLIRRGFSYSPYLKRWHERFGFVRRIDADSLIWVHAVSVGEVRTIVRLVEYLRGRYPESKILVTTMTPTGSVQVEQCLGDSVKHCYVPYDLPGSVKRFLDRTRPTMAFIVETEFWPNIFRLCDERSIPLVLVNVRVSARSFNGYRRFPRFMRNMLAKAKLVMVQTEGDAARLRTLGASADRMHVTGNLKFDVFPPPDTADRATQLRGQWGETRPVWIAASTHDGEEKIVLKAFEELRERHPNLLLVLVPRHPERFKRVAELCQDSGLQVALRSQNSGALTPGTDVLVGNTMGELTQLYAAADIAFIGGSLVRHGGHNLVEALAVGVPTVFGPHMFNFEQSSSVALKEGAAVQSSDGKQLTAMVAAYLDDPALARRAALAAKKVVETNRGSLQATQSLIEKVMPQLV